MILHSQKNWIIVHNQNCHLPKQNVCRKDVRLPIQLQRAMAAEAEAAREARAKVIFSLSMLFFVIFTFFYAMIFVICNFHNFLCKLRWLQLRESRRQVKPWRRWEQCFCFFYEWWPIKVFGTSGKQLELNNQASDVMAQSHVALQLRYLQVANNFWHRHQGLKIIIFMLF